MKELINTISDPIYSFPLFTLAFLWAWKNYHFVGTKKFAWTAFIIAIPVSAWFYLDPNFNYIITFPDNIPIVLLIALVAFTTWLCFHKASINDKRIEQGLGPVEGMPENREKVWCWPNLVYTELFAMLACTAFL